MKITNHSYHIEATYHDDDGRTLTALDIQLAIENYIADQWPEDSGPVDIEVTKQQ